MNQVHHKFAHGNRTGKYDAFPRSQLATSLVVEGGDRSANSLLDNTMVLFGHSKTHVNRNYPLVLQAEVTLIETQLILEVPRFSAAIKPTFDHVAWPDRLNRSPIAPVRCRNSVVTSVHSRPSHLSGIVDVVAHFCCCVLSVLLAIPVQAQNWPQGSGPNGNWTAEGKNPPTSWSASTGEHRLANTSAGIRARIDCVGRSAFVTSNVPGLKVSQATPSRSEKVRWGQTSSATAWTRKPERFSGKSR